MSVNFGETSLQSPDNIMPYGKVNIKYTYKLNQHWAADINIDHGIMMGYSFPILLKVP